MGPGKADQPSSAELQEGVSSLTRPLALIKVIETSAAKFAYVLSPTASLQHNSEPDERFSKLLLESAWLGTALTPPMIPTLGVLGDLAVSL